MSKAAEEGLRLLARHCFTLLDVAEDVAAALDHKNPKGGRRCGLLGLVYSVPWCLRLFLVPTGGL
jgi:hypothetical protein